MEIKKNLKLVQCVSIDLNSLSTFCNNVRCKEYHHSYESNFDISNRYLITIKIRIDETTLRCCLTYQPNRSFTFSKRKYNKQLKENGIIPDHLKLKIQKGLYLVKF